MTINITLLSRRGDQHSIEANEDISLMENFRDAGIDEMLALCGGSCSCATCHVYIEEKFYDRVLEASPMSIDENELLDGSLHRGETSRLSCQIKAEPFMEGMLVRLAPED